MPRNATARQTDAPPLAGLSGRAFDPSEPIPQELQPTIEGVIELHVSAMGLDSGEPVVVDISGVEEAAEILTTRFLAVLRDVVRQLPTSRREKAYHDAIWTLKGND